MTTAEANLLHQAVDTLKQATDVALQHECPDEFSFVERHINEMEAIAREMQQAMWSDEAQEAIERLESGEPLTESDWEVVRTFLISDAQHYVALENNYRDWVSELKRLTDEIAHRAHCPDRRSVAELRGVLKDAIRLVPDIRNFLEEKRRIHKFETALETLDEPSRQMMAHILREQLESPKR